ncbi:MAG: DNA polymerase Y family protein [Chloroflexota bacterium]
MEIACLVVPTFMLACERAEPPERAGPISMGGLDEHELNQIDGAPGREEPPSPLGEGWGEGGPPEEGWGEGSLLPLAVVDGRVVLEASPAAARDGVHTGQALREALACCPRLATVDARPARYAARFAAILAAVEQITPVVEPGPLGVIYAGLQGLARLFPERGALPRALLACVPATFHPRLGIGPGKFPALVAACRARAGRAYVLQEQRVAAALAPVSIDLLPADEAVKRRLHLLGLTTLGRLAALPRAAVAAQFGPLGQRLWDLAQGHDPDAIQPRPRPEVVTAQMAFETPVVSREALVAAAERLAGQSVHALAQRQRAARQAVLRATTERSQLWERVVTFKEASGERARVWTAIRSALEGATFPGPVVDLTLELTALTPAVAHQEVLWPDARRRQQERLHEALRQLKARYGFCPVGRIVELEPWSRVPERRVALLAYDP